MCTICSDVFDSSCFVSLFLCPIFLRLSKQLVRYGESSAIDQADDLCQPDVTSLSNVDRCCGQWRPVKDKKVDTLNQV